MTNASWASPFSALAVAAPRPEPLPPAAVTDAPEELPPATQVTASLVLKVGDPQAVADDLVKRVRIFAHPDVAAVVRGHADLEALVREAAAG
jgi:hypothetical protein